MNREIKFRGKGVDSNKWYYGGYAEDCGHNHVILPQDNWSKGGVVDKDTIGQFTGKIDKNKKEIFSGDLLKDQDGVVYEIWYSEETAAFMAEMVKPANDMVDILGGYDTERCFEVIGNIYDNTDLLED